MKALYRLFVFATLCDYNGRIGKRNSWPRASTGKFGYLQLVDFLDALQPRIQLQKDKEKECKRKSAATIAFDQYLALSGLKGKINGQRDLSYKLKIGRRWKKLASSSGLLLLAFSDVVEDFV